MAALRSEGMRGVWVLGALVVLLVGLSVVYFATAKARSRMETCQLNLKLLAMEVNGASPASLERWEGVPTGSAFWTEHAKWPMTTVRPIRPLMLLCPVRGAVKGRSGTDFRGPAMPLGKLAPDDPLGADKVGNHGDGQGGNVALRDGSVHHARPTDPVWIRASQTTSE